MKISRNGKNTIISDINDNSVAALIRFNAPTCFVFTTVKNIEYKVTIQATLDGKCSLRTSKNEYIKTFEETLSFIGEMMKKGVLTLELDNNIYTLNRKFYDITEKINQKLSKKVKYFEYNHDSNFYSIVYKEKNNLPNKLHYFENNNSVLLFDEKGAHLLFGQATKKIQSVLDILTKE